MELHGIIACICEGSAEHAIIDLLLDNGKLCFEKQNLLDDKIIKIRSAEKFEEMYLRKDFAEKIIVLRILDSRRERFKLSKLYASKVDVYNIITAPEIEMLIILKEHKYDEYKKLYNKTGIKPSEYCKVNLKHKDVKSYDFVKKYFSNIDDLIYAIGQYRSVIKVRQEETTLYDLLKSE